MFLWTTSRLNSEPALLVQKNPDAAMRKWSWRELQAAQRQRNIHKPCCLAYKTVLRMLLWPVFTKKPEHLRSSHCVSLRPLQLSIWHLRMNLQVISNDITWSDVHWLLTRQRKGLTFHISCTVSVPSTLFRFFSELVFDVERNHCVISQTITEVGS